MLEADYPKRLQRSTASENFDLHTKLQAVFYAFLRRRPPSPMFLNRSAQQRKLLFIRRLYLISCDLFCMM